MNTSYPRSLMALAEITERQARQLRFLSRIQLVQTVTIVILASTQIVHTFAIARVTP